MAWLDERVWCHPKFSDVSDAAFRVYVHGIAYSSGFATKGHLSPGQQKKIGSDAEIRRELVTAKLWDTRGRDGVYIHDWDEHNAKRDARREADRERKKRARAGPSEGQDDGTSAGTSAGQSTGRSAGQSQGASTGTARVDGSEGSDGSEEEGSTVTRNSVVPSYEASYDANEPRPEPDEPKPAANPNGTTTENLEGLGKINYLHALPKREVAS